MKNRWVVLVILVVTLAVVSGCAARKPQTMDVVKEGPVVVEREVEKSALAMPTPASAPLYAGANEEKAREIAAEGERMIIRTVNMSILVEETDETLEELYALVKFHKGYIADSNRWLEDDNAMARVTLRVPAESLDPVLEAIRGMAIEVDSESLSGQDVTEEYTDLQARLGNLEAAEEQLLALLAEAREMRWKAEDILAVHRELTNIRQQIESLKGREQYLERMTALATIHVSIRAKPVPKVDVEKGWNPLVTLSDAAGALFSLAQLLVDIGIYLIIFSPVVLVPAAIIWMIVRGLRRRKED